MISDRSTMIFLVLLVAIGAFFAWSLRKRQRLHLLHKMYLSLMGTYAIWISALIGMRFATEDQTTLLFVLDCFTQAGYFCAALYLCIAIVFAFGYEKLPKWSGLLFVMPTIGVLVCITNPLHHLQYVKFSVIKSEVVFGPFLTISGVYCYMCLIASIALMINFAQRNPSGLYRKQCAMISLGGVCPLVVSMVATLTDMNLPITATALSFIPNILFNGIAIYELHLLDIMPVATQEVLDRISDGYLILSDKGLVISYNEPFANIFASQYGIAENRYLRDCVKEEDVSKKTAIYNMITAVDACGDSQSIITYEQAAVQCQGGAVRKNYYVTDVTPLIINGKSAGYIIIFKDITQLKRSIHQLQDSEKHMLEQERFAFLGQMIGGLAHNLKTPIMSISGCISAADGLLDECLDSLKDPVVTKDDYREIYGEIRDWFQKIQEATAYMSDIITAIKGQATNVSANEDSEFTLDELVKRTTLLMRHELVSSGCTLVVEHCDEHESISLRGDINNLIQVMGNLVSNAIYAQKQVGGGAITVGMSHEHGQLKLYVKDRGTGIPENVRNRLFKEMVTSKGTQGSGLGLYISNAVVRGKFGGTMWAQENPGGGTIIGMTIPIHEPDHDQVTAQGESIRYETV